MPGQGSGIDLRTGEWNYSIYKEGLMYVGAIAELEPCIANASTGEWVCEIEKEIEQIAGKGEWNKNLWEKDSSYCRPDDFDWFRRWCKKELCNFSGCFG